MLTAIKFPTAQGAEAMLYTLENPQKQQEDQLRADFGEESVVRQ